MSRALLLLMLVSLPAWGEIDVAFDPHPGNSVPGNVAFRESRLDAYYGRVPVVLVLGYLGCVNLCGTTLTGVSEALQGTGLVAERDYRAIFMSIDPRDEKAPPQRRAGWHFLTGADAAAKVAQAVGFRYQFEKESGQFAHPAGFVLLTPEGKVSRYFEGVRFDSRALLEGIRQAGEGRTQTTFQELLFVCFHDPLGGRNTPAVMAALRIAMAALLAALGFFAWRQLR